MRLAVVAALLLMLSPLQAAAGHRADRFTYATRILGQPNSGDERAFRTQFQHKAQGMSDSMFQALSKTLGGQSPSLNFVDSIVPANGQSEVHLEASPGQNAVSLDPYAVESFIDDEAQTHSGAVNQMPHEMAHLRQTADVLASLQDREGGAQAFADDVSPLVASAAKTYYDRSRNYDGAYTAYVAQAQGKGKDWLYGGQFGHAPIVPR